MGSVKAGYWASWNSNDLNAAAIRSELFTHLFCAFSEFNPATNEITIPGDNRETFPTDVKQNNGAVKALICIFGGNVLHGVVNNMANDEISRGVFIGSCIREARKCGYDGIDLNLYWDREHQSTHEEMINMENLLREFRAAITLESSSTGKPPLLLTAVLPFTSRLNGVNDIGPIQFPTGAIRECLDWVNVMAYDFFHPGQAGQGHTTLPHSALRIPQGVPDDYPDGNVCGSRGIDDWINSGVPANQIVLGLPFYGYSWKLQDPNINGIFALADGPDNTIANNEMPGYNQIRNFIDNPLNNAQRDYLAEYVTNYCYSGSSWTTYDDTQAISTKVMYARGKKLLGYFAWNLNHDFAWTLSVAAFVA